jgi:hypothetical protein
MEMFQLRKLTVAWIIPVLLVVCLTGSAAQAKYSGGSGTVDDPYQIATAADLIALGSEPNDYDKCFILTADIDLDPNLPGRKVFDRAVIAPTPFSGEFDGNSHVVSNLTIKGGGNLGLFGRLASTANIRNLGIVNANIASKADYNTGALVGENGGCVAQCYSTGSLAGENGIGGLVGLNSYGNVIFCSSSGSVSGKGYVGGLVGNNWNGFIGQCLSVGSVKGQSNTGGLVGYGYMAHVIASFWDIQTSGQTSSSGGTGKSTAELYGIAIYLVSGWDFVDEIKNGTSQVWMMPARGGYPILTIFSGHAVPRLQGLGTVEAPYLISDSLGLGAMTYNSRRAYYRLGAPVDLSGIFLQLPVIPVFTGTLDGNNLTISHVTITGDSYVGLFGRIDAGSCVRNLGLVDVNIVGSGYNVGAIAGSSGDYYHDVIDAQGVTSKESEGGDIIHCYSTGRVHGDDYGVGGLVGFRHGGSFTRCSSGAEVTGSSSVGGLVGENNAGEVTQCHSDGVVSGIQPSDHRVGGLVGLTYGPITQCYNTGSVTGSPGLTGGLIGELGSVVTNCYSTGVVTWGSYSHAGGLVGYVMPPVSRGGTVSVPPSDPNQSVRNCFWDIQASGCTWSDGGVGKTTAEMKTASTFLDAGWDFFGETANGTQDIWWIDEGKDYPRLWWERSVGE